MSNNVNENQLIEQLSKAVHNPRGPYADKDAMYAELKQRTETLTSTEYAIHPVRKSATFRRVAIAAGFLLVVGLGIACVCQYSGLFQSFMHETMIVAPVAEGAEVTVEEFCFENATLSEAVAQLSSAYGVGIEIADESLCNYRVTATFSSEEPIDEILGILTEVVGCQMTELNGKYFISFRKD